MLFCMGFFRVTGPTISIQSVLWLMQWAVQVSRDGLALNHVESPPTRGNIQVAAGLMVKNCIA